MKQKKTMNTPLQSADQIKPRILVVDDEADILQVVTLSLQQSGFSVSSAENTESACLLLQKELFDAVVTDVMMPGGDGITFLSKIHREYPKIPVILMTGHAQLQMAIDAIKNGAFDFIQKPFDFDLINNVVGKAVNYSKQQNLEQNRREELEEALAVRTTELEKVKVELDLAHSKILKAVTYSSQPKDIAPAESNTSESVFKIISRIV